MMQDGWVAQFARFQVEKSMIPKTLITVFVNILFFIYILENKKIFRGLKRDNPLNNTFFALEVDR